MKPLRWLGAGLLWILAGVVGLLGLLLSVTVILLPIGIPLLMLARKLVALAGALIVPKAIRHPSKELGDKSRDAGTVVAKGSRRVFGHGRKALVDSVPDRSKKLPKKVSKRVGRRKGLGRLKWWS